MEDLKCLTRPAVSIIFAVAFVTFTAMGMIPIQVFISLAVTTIIWWYRSRDKEKANARTNQG